MFNTILVPLDGSPLAERALEPAAALARRSNGELILLSVPFLKHVFVQERGGYGLLLPPDSLRQSQQELTEYLQSKTGEWEHPSFVIRAELLGGDPASVIVDTATDEEVDLIVMSTHGRSGLSRWMLGSVTERVMHGAPCPVLAVRSSEPLSRVLIPLDRSELSRDALEPGLEVARCFGSEVTLLTVMKPINMTHNDVAYLESLESGLVGHYKDTLYAECEAYLRAIVRSRQPLVLPNIQIEVVEGPAARQILEFAEQWPADLIVMSTHGRSGLQRWIYGSVTQKVLQGAGCGMLIVRPPANSLN